MINQNLCLEEHYFENCVLILIPKLWGFLLETSSGIVLRIYLLPFVLYHCLSVQLHWVLSAKPNRNITV